MQISTIQNISHLFKLFRFLPTRTQLCIIMVFSCFCARYLFILLNVTLKISFKQKLKLIYIREKQNGGVTRLPESTYRWRKADAAPKLEVELLGIPNTYQVGVSFVLICIFFFVLRTFFASILDRPTAGSNLAPNVGPVQFLHPMWGHRVGASSDDGSRPTPPAPRTNPG